MPKEAINEDALMEIALDAGAQDIKNEDNSYDIITEPQAFDGVKKALDGKSVKYMVAEVTMVPKTLCQACGQGRGGHAEPHVRP